MEYPSRKDSDMNFRRRWIVASALCALMSFSASAGDGVDRATADRLALIELANRYAWGIDTLDRTMLSTVFTHDAVAEYVEVGSNVLGMNERLEGFDAIWTWLHAGLANRKGHDGLPMHYMTNHLVELNGDRARVRCFQHNRSLAAGGVYTMDAVRTEQGWRVQKLRLEEQIWKPEMYRAPAEQSSD